MSDRPTPETDAECPYCKAMPMGMIAKVRWTCGSYGGPTGRSERCKERANAWEQRDVALRERDEAREQVKELIYISERAIDLAEIDFENDKFGVVSELRDGLEKIKEETK